MKSVYRCNIGGFTLIELLVVVLIIGILSSVALPQYTRAVEKSRLTEAELTLKALGDAQARCVLENGEGEIAGLCGQGREDGNLFDNMDIDLPYNQTTYDNLPAMKSKNFAYYLDGEYISADRLRGETLLYHLEHNPYTRQVSCSNYEIECKTLGYSKDDGGSWVKP